MRYAYQSNKESFMDFNTELLDEDICLKIMQKSDFDKLYDVACQMSTRIALCTRRKKLK